MEDLRIETVPSQDGTQLLKLTGAFTISTMAEFQKLARENQARITYLDLSGVPYMDSASLGALLGFHVSCQREGRKYALVAVSDRLNTLFKVAGVEGMLPTYPTLEAAQAAVA